MGDVFSEMETNRSLQAGVDGGAPGARRQPRMEDQDFRREDVRQNPNRVTCMLPVCVS